MVQASRPADPALARSIVLVHENALIRELLAAFVAARVPELPIRAVDSVAHLPRQPEAPAGVTIVDTGLVDPDDEQFGHLLAALHAALGEDCPVLVLSDRETADDAWLAIRHGAQGYLPAHLGTGLLVPAIRLLMSGGLFVPPNALRDAARPEQIRCLP